MSVGGPVAPDTEDPLLGRVLSERYRILSKLGEGGMGVVYLAEHVVIEKKIALKVLFPDLTRRADLVQRFIQEAKSASRIGHENVIDITDFGQSPEGYVFLAMEYLSGQDLGQLLKATGPIIGFAHLPADVTRPLAKRAGGDGAAGADGPHSFTQAQELASAMLDRGESFWAAVYPLFVARDLTRADLRKVIQTGLERTNGNYRMLVELFNMPSGDYKRFLSFLRKHDCHLPFQRFRAVPARLQAPGQGIAKTS